MRFYAIGDIHGQLEKLLAAHTSIEEDRRQGGDPEAPIVHVGDLVDRGPDSRGVIAHLMDGIARGENWVVLKGNHDRMFASFLADPGRQDTGLRPEHSWLLPNLGGAATLSSYGVARAGHRPLAEVHAEARALVPPDHLAFVEGLPLWHQGGEAVFVHAGIRPGIPMARQVEDDLVWIRAGFLDDPRDHGALVVHGHTTIAEATHYGNRLNIDTGAGYGGPLTAVAVEGRAAWLLTARGRVAIPPAPGLQRSAR
jgi:serine/threonine protein phosphatase 1